MLEAAFMAKVTVGTAPKGGTLPVPVHPVQTNWTPGPGQGEVTDAVIDVPLSNHPLVGVGESYKEETVK
jgi:hypothetical protein